MVVLRMEAIGVNEKGRGTREDIGTAANNEVAETALESVAKNYAKGMVLVLWEKKKKKWVNLKEVKAKGPVDSKPKTSASCQVWATVESDQLNAKDISGTEVDTVQYKVLTLKNSEDANCALTDCVEVTPRNTSLSLRILDDNQHWKIVKVRKGHSKKSWGDTNADDQPDTEKKEKEPADPDQTDLEGKE